ncbi:spore coat protein JB [Clostridium tetanomorphum]|uniref:Spore coat protein CotJB n=1 Tax=Clostridium tetanomorphum TaxID=1553 RepID=A0A923ED31_CLOTT|nr:MULTISPECIES: spore coat protein CotJB [Clostridium]KAJ50867.1 Spore coat protein COTJB [Clostridium tetanomorphum DSM 665]MBC2398360.1 spore coat protein CotJB [Clostridium tetanomorphum]MBC2425535.1 spore coat protein CotJB [Clostridium beijerinckii]MBP1865511.1 spore coat protein JB [Clostridium tetanomorphum]NRS86457.1 spore coat protein JB [Clostridium tetanomorphum]
MSKEIDKMDLLRQICALNFVLEDLSLYLNTHPTDGEALAKYNSCVVSANALKKKYESCFGMLSEHSSQSPCPWQWINEPWPWEYEANFRLCGEER